MFFRNDSEFITSDPRKDRGTTTVSAESLNKRCAAILPEWLIKDKTILDLGSCLGAFGHWALSHGAKHYTGVEMQKQFADISTRLLSDYSNATIINSGVEEFLESCKQYDIVIACGVIHGVTDVIGLLKSISNASSGYVIIESLDIDEREYPTIQFKPYRMVKSEENGSYNFFSGITPIIGAKATAYVMSECDCDVDGGKIVPERIVTSHDAYTELVDGKKADISPHRFILRFKKRTAKMSKNSLQYNMIKGNGNPIKKNVGWKFDDSVASRFQHEARTNIPDYDRVIDLCVKVADNKLNRESKIIDVGSALGHTIDVFTKAGYTNVTGVECSQAMIDNSLYKDRITLSDLLPDQKYDMILINWTLHFIKDKASYLTDALSKLNDGGVLIVSDKTTQSQLVEDLYYDFKRSNGISEEYIQSKKESLKNVMFTEDVKWYIDFFNQVEIINSRYGFVTFYYQHENS